MRADYLNNMIIYVVYPSSFYDANGDGIGDLQGIKEKLDYFVYLGVNTICLGPIFDSPEEDGGFDVSSYYEINKYLGSKEDLASLIKEAHQKGLKIILTFEVNHTSIEHPWFKKAKADPSSKEASYYYFKQGKNEEGKLLPPNNWKGYFYESAWTKLKDDLFYLSLFSSSTADLNLDNAELKEELFNVGRYYLKLGVDGFYFANLESTGKDLSFSDSILPDDGTHLIYDEGKHSLNEISKRFVQEFREKVLEKRDDICLLSTLPSRMTPYAAREFTSRDNNVLDLGFNYDIFWNNDSYKQITKQQEDIHTNVLDLKQNIYKWYRENHDLTNMPLLWGNYDFPRVLSMYGDLNYRTQSATALFTTFLFLFKTPVLYMGEEIGMSNSKYDNVDDYLDDVFTRNEVNDLIHSGYKMKDILTYLQRASRVNSRSPFQWNKEEYAGFSKVLPRRKVNQDYLEGINVNEESQNIYSILGFYRYALEKRKDDEIKDIINNGELTLLDENHPDVFAYVHEGNEKLVVITSFRPYITYFSFYHRIRDIILHNYEDVLLDSYTFTLRPFETYLIKIG